MTSSDGIAARLRDVVFSYDRGADLDTADLSADADPDDREGPVLRGLDLDVPAGSFTVVMGASGGGKSTMLRTLNAIIPDFIDGSFRGEVNVLGRDATQTRVSEMAHDAGMVLQDYESQLFGTSVEAEVAFGPENLAVPPEDIGPRIDESLSLVGLPDLDRRREPSGLSGGQKQRLVFAGVAATRPDLLVLDEPTSDLDPKGTRDIVDVVTRLSEQEGQGWSGPETIVMVTHKIEEALLADRAVLLKGGKAFRSGPLQEVFTDVEALREARVAVPPLVEAFDALGWPDEDLPLVPKTAAEQVRASDLTYTGPKNPEQAPAGTGAETGEMLFELNDVEYAYETDRGPVTAVDGVDMAVREGEVVALVGHNGSGKTTLAKHFNGLHAADAGDVTYKGRSVPDYRMSEIGREVGYVFQNPDHQIFADTVREEVAFGPENFGLEGEELDRRVDHALETVELDGLDDEDPFSFSKGQRQRVALAGILATDPEVIVFDEPTTGLDAAQQRQFMDLVGKLNREEGLTVVMVTHDMATVARYAPRTVVMQDGRVAYDRATRDLFADESLLAQYDLVAPHPTELANHVRDDDDAPALTAEELVTALGGEGVYSGGEQ
ncbi:ABC transporter ATP-binding protein [Halolamina salifodinae]|uniref:Energy-coupling factor transport system ATP-binding protein n=1 Tax=Halolamina salifodinae TaxID=1202767 RepID=A0A8T4GX92_9EURY|nr:energy-coupling factor transporter ATPase [Halolamina salifodinae]MBP1987080.1 energy-coupling factor transport system ATP-binding protein [Halolamina salifodinae]